MKKLQEQGLEHFENEKFTKEFHHQGASSMLGLLVSAGMPPEFLDEVEEGMREGK